MKKKAICKKCKLQNKVVVAKFATTTKHGAIDNKNQNSYKPK